MKSHSVASRQDLAPARGDEAVPQRRRWVAGCAAARGLLPPMVAVAVTAVASVAAAQQIGDLMGKESVTNRPLILLVALAALALVPFVLIMVTSFVKIAVVLSIVRQAIGTQQIPPTQVVTGMAVVVTIYIMMPVGLDMYYMGRTRLLQEPAKHLTLQTMRPELLVDIAKVSQEPLRGFLIKHAHLKDRDMLFKLAWRMRQPRDRATLTDEDFSVVIPAFVISELKEAFQIGFILFVPFLAVDMIVSNILMALGMQMLSPTTISLPFKILLFVLVDGWHLVTKGLVIGYS